MEQSRAMSQSPPAGDGGSHFSTAWRRRLQKRAGCRQIILPHRRAVANLHGAVAICDNQGMWLPQFSLRTTLRVITAAAVISVVAAQAVSGRAWAIGMIAAGGSVAAALLTFGATYAGCQLLSGLVGARPIVAKTSRGALLRDEGAGPAPAGIESNTPRTEAQ